MQGLGRCGVAGSRWRRGVVWRSKAGVVDPKLAATAGWETRGKGSQGVFKGGAGDLGGRAVGHVGERHGEDRGLC